MNDLTEAGRIQFCGLFRQIIQQNPPLISLSLEAFSDGYDNTGSIGEIILEAILSSRV